METDINIAIINLKILYWPGYKVSKKAKMKNRYNQVPRHTQYTSDKKHNKTSHTTRELRGQHFSSRLPQGYSANHVYCHRHGPGHLLN